MQASDIVMIIVTAGAALAPVVVSVIGGFVAFIWWHYRRGDSKVERLEDKVAALEADQKRTVDEATLRSVVKGEIAGVGKDLHGLRTDFQDFRAELVQIDKRVTIVERDVYGERPRPSGQNRSVLDAHG